jgi:hypothetical protein
LSPDDEVHGDVLLEDRDVRMGPDLFGERCLDGGPGGVGGVDDAPGAVPAFAGEVVADGGGVGREGDAVVDQPADGPGAVLDDKRVALSEHRPAPAVWVSAMWASALSLGSSTEAMPPWAQALALSSRLRLVTRATLSLSAGSAGRAIGLQDHCPGSVHRKRSLREFRRGDMGAPTIAWAPYRAEIGKTLPLTELCVAGQWSTSEGICGLSGICEVGDRSGHDNEGRCPPTMSDREVDQQLVERVQRGDKQALACLWRSISASSLACCRD